MIAVAALFIFAIGVIALFPDIPIARRLRDTLILKPAEALTDKSATDIARLAALPLLLIVLVSAGPELKVWLAAVGDVTLLAEMLVALWMVGIVAPWRLAVRLGLAASQRIALVVGRVRGARARRRRRRGVPPPRSADEPDPCAAWACALEA